MRVNTRQCMAAYLDGKAHRKAEAIHTDGVVIWSYTTAIAVPVSPVEVWVTEERHSQTTTVQTNGVVECLTKAGKVVKRVPQAEVDREARRLRR